MVNNQKYQKMNGKRQGNNFKRVILSCFIMLLASQVTAQEFDCDVTVNDRQINDTSLDYISELGPDIENYLNNHRWTNDRYNDFEKIQCTIQIVLTGSDGNFNFTSEVVFSTRRPIYDTIQQSVNILITDNNWRFNYPRNKNMLHDDLQFDDLTSFLDFYAYILLAFDYDSFERLGGTEYINRAQNVFDLGQNSGVQGWGRSIGAQRNRFGLISDLSNPAYEGVRIATYLYYRMGIDLFTTRQQEARQGILEAVELLQQTKRSTSNNYLFDIFFGSKYREITAAFLGAELETRLEAYNLLRDVDPAHSTEYEKLQN
jgi:hypothetical protein